MRAAAKGAVDVVLAVLRGYGLEGDDAIHAARAVRSALHGFVALEAGAGRDPRRPRRELRADGPRARPGAARRAGHLAVMTTIPKTAMPKNAIPETTDSAAYAVAEPDRRLQQRQSRRGRRR